MRNSGKRSYLKPVRYEIFPPEIYYIIFEFLIPPCERGKLGGVKYDSTLTQFMNKTILTMLLTSKNWSNLFKNYVILAGNRYTKNSIYGGFKYNLYIFSLRKPSYLCKNDTWYKYIKNVTHDDNHVFQLFNNWIIGKYRMSYDESKKYSIVFRIDKSFVITVYYSVCEMRYYLDMQNSTEDNPRLKYILCAYRDDKTIKQFLIDSYTYLPDDHPDWAVIKGTVMLFNLFA